MAKNKKYYWLKLKTDFFRSLAMKKLRRIAGGDTYTIIYLKLQLLSLADEGLLHYEGIESTFYEEMALALDEDIENVRATLIFLESMGLIVKNTDHEYLLTEVPLLIGSETDSAERVRNFRKKKALQCNTTVTSCNTEIEIEKEIDKEIEIEKRERVDYQLIADMYNDTCVSFPRITTLSDSRKKAIKARLKTYTVDDFKKLFIMAEASNFLKGANNRNWSATFDWLIKDNNMTKVLEGNYSNRGSSNNSNSVNKTAEELDDFYNMASKWAESED